MPDHSEEEDREVPFFPNVLLAEVSLAIAVIGMLTIFVSLFPLKLGEKFDPMNPPSVLEPEWYFMGMYQLLKTQSMDPLYGVLIAGALGVLMMLIPFLDRGPERSPIRRPIFTAFALFVIVEFLALTIYGYLTPGEVASFSDIGFRIVFLVTNFIAFGLLALVFVAHRRIVRGARR